MSTITYDTASVAPTGKPAAAPVAPQKGRFARMIERMVEARQQQAMDEIRRYTILLPDELERAGRKLGERNEDSLPFVR